MDRDVKFLAKYLKKQLGEDISIVYCFDDLMDGYFKGNYFHVTFKDAKYLMISFAGNSQKRISLLEEIQPVLSEFVGIEPTCRYSLHFDSRSDNSAEPTMEWLSENVEQRIKNLANDTAFITLGAHVWNFIQLNTTVGDEVGKG